MKISPTSILTFSGQYFDRFDPDPDKIDLIVIAHSLSNQCRFNGHCRQFYSVAEHSYLAAFLAPKDAAAAVLLHDAAEAYMGDLVRPLKQKLPDYSWLEDRLQSIIYKKFRIQPQPAMVKSLDAQMLFIEKEEAMQGLGHDWAGTIEPVNRVKLQFHQPREAREMFMLWAARVL